MKKHILDFRSRSLLWGKLLCKLQLDRGDYMGLYRTGSLALNMIRPLMSAADIAKRFFFYENLFSLKTDLDLSCQLPRCCWADQSEARSVGP